MMSKSMKLFRFLTDVSPPQNFDHADMPIGDT